MTDKQRIKVLKKHLKQVNKVVKETIAINSEEHMAKSILLELCEFQESLKWAIGIVAVLAQVAYDKWGE